MSEHEIETVSGLSTYKNDNLKAACKDGSEFEIDVTDAIKRVNEVQNIPRELRKLKSYLAKITVDLDNAMDGIKQNDLLTYGKPKEEIVIK